MRTDTRLSRADEETRANAAAHDDHLNMTSLEDTTELSSVLFGSLVGVVEHFAHLGSREASDTSIDDIKPGICLLPQVTGDGRLA